MFQLSGFYCRVFVGFLLWCLVAIMGLWCRGIPLRAALSFLEESELWAISFKVVYNCGRKWFIKHYKDSKQGARTRGPQDTLWRSLGPCYWPPWILMGSVLLVSGT